MPYPTPAPNTPPITAPTARFRLLITAPSTAPPAPPITAPFVDLLQPLSFWASAGCVAGAEAVLDDSEVEEPWPFSPVEPVPAAPGVFVLPVASDLGSVVCLT